MTLRAAAPGGALLLTAAFALLRDPAAAGDAALAAGARPMGATPATPAVLLAAEPAAPAAALAFAGARSAEQIEQALYGTGSLRLAAPDGGFALDGAGRLRPDIALRRRFDQLLTALGEASPAELGSLLRAQAQRSMPAPAVGELMRLWQQYLQLQQHRFSANAEAADASGWQAALDERIRVRRELLGAAWADAFYRDEEAALRAHIAVRQGAAGDAGRSAADTPLMLPAAARMPQRGEDSAALQQQRVAAFGAEAAQRLHALDLAQADWERRLDAARQKVERAQAAAELSPPQRQVAIDEVLGSSFDPHEQLRARALLGLN